MPSVLVKPRDRAAAGRKLSLNFQRSGSGKPLILIHGIGGELCVWQPV